jgi:PKHD-type hydroxylase
MTLRVNKIGAIFNKFCICNEMFSSDEIEKIVFLEKIMKFEKGAVGIGTGEAQDAPEVRSCDVSNFIPDENSGWIFQKIANFIPRINYDHFMLNIGWLSPFQYTIYKAKNKGHYDWHHDVFPAWHNSERKISGIMFLNSPDEYEGGELEIMTSGSPDRTEIIKGNPGDVVFFSSMFPHRVKPVTKGTRKTIVFWVEGERE